MGTFFAIDAFSCYCRADLINQRFSVSSETNVSLPQRKLSKDLDSGSVRLEIGLEIGDLFLFLGSRGRIMVIGLDIPFDHHY